MATDPIHGRAPWALTLVAVPVGCFLADGADMLWNQTSGQAWDLLCHHLVGVSCLSTTILSGHCAGFSVVSLLLELKSSACLHLRSCCCFLTGPHPWPPLWPAGPRWPPWPFAAWYLRGSPSSTTRCLLLWLSLVELGLPLWELRAPH